MITVSIFGGLGNQMFQYAAAKAVATRLSKELRIDNTAFEEYRLRNYLLQHLCVPEQPTASSPKTVRRFAEIRIRNRLNRLSTRIGLGELASARDTYVEPHFHVDTKLLELRHAVTIFGYFQSERYFSSISHDIRQFFQPREPLSSTASSAAELIASSPLPVSLHIRRGDYVSNKEAARVHGTLGIDYYRKALNLLAQAVGGDIDLFVFSDEPETAARELSFHSGRMTSISGSADRPWEDLALMARCRHHIIANSSFSWWGAWMNPADKIVVAPRAWFSPIELRQRNTCDLYPSDWILI